jgi:hypothetical protein
MDYSMTVTPIDPGNRIELPADWTQSLGLCGQVALERTSDGILVRPWPRVTWEEISATKLVIGSAPPDRDENSAEMTGDDFLF